MQHEACHSDEALRTLPGGALLPPPSSQPATKLKVDRYKMLLPSTCISFCSNEGKQIFKEALATEYMHAYFRLAAHFSTQSEPAYCGLSTLATALNALEVDPHCVWKSPWRWYDESMFDCCIDLQDARRQGITLIQFVRLAECNGLVATCIRPLPADADGEGRFRDAVRNATARDDVVPVVSFSRAALQQNGDGHFSAVAGYHEARDLALVLDTARFKYYPYWTPLSLLYEAMKPMDSATGLSRGYCLLRKASSSAATRLRLDFPVRRGGLSLVRQGLCALLHTTTLADVSLDSASLWNSVIDVIVRSVVTPAAAKQPPVALQVLRVDRGEVGVGGLGASFSEPDRCCHCPAAAVGSGGWTMLRRCVEQSPVFSLCVDRARHIRAAAAAALTECERPGFACCAAAAHAAAALRPAHQLALLILSWPFGSVWHAAAHGGESEQGSTCCLAGDGLKAVAMAMESCTKDALTKQGNATLNSVTDLLRAQIAVLLKESTSFG